MTWSEQSSSALVHMHTYTMRLMQCATKYLNVQHFLVFQVLNYISIQKFTLCVFHFVFVCGFYKIVITLSLMTLFLITLAIENRCFSLPPLSPRFISSRSILIFPATSVGHKSMFAITIYVNFARLLTIEAPAFLIYPNVWYVFFSVAHKFYLMLLNLCAQNHMLFILFVLLLSFE